MPLRAVLFDYGHTLIDFSVPEDALYDVYHYIRARLVAEAESELPEAQELVELVARRVTRSVEASYTRDRLVELDILKLFEDSLSGLGFIPHTETVRWVAEVEHDALTKHLVCLPQTVDTLAAITRAGLQIGIISNAHLLPYMMRRDWQSLGIAPFVSASLISSEVGIRKPHPDVFKRVLAALRVAPEEAVFVGDRLLDDVSGAQGVGMQAILTREFRQEDVQADGPQPRLVVDRLPDILPFVLEAAAA